MLFVTERSPVMVAQEALVLPGPLARIGSTRPATRRDRGALEARTIEVREGHLGQGVYAIRPLREGQLILRGWGEPIPHRTRHTIQVDADQHLLPHAPLQLLNHSCAPNC